MANTPQAPEKSKLNQQPIEANKSSAPKSDVSKNASAKDCGC